MRLIPEHVETQNLILPLGPIEGAKRKTIYDIPYYSFEGIPYGKPPVGELRFKAPQPAEPWSETLNCTKCGNKPTQKNVFMQNIEGAEDCLNLNVYVKKLDSPRPLPVMVWIFGGSFFMGEASRKRASPDYLMREDIVLVTLNYRLCSLGFLSLKDPTLDVPGNAALKDQILALKWVKNYISYFNGDPENITLFGESAGAASAHYLMLTDQTKGLFHRCILMSGSALNFWANLPSEDMAYRLAKYNGYTGPNIDRQVLAFLQTLKPAQLVNHDILNANDLRNGYTYPFGPTIEPYVGKDCVVPKSPFEMLKTAWSNKIPLIIGGTSGEGMLVYPFLRTSPLNMKACETDRERLLPVELRYIDDTVAEKQHLCEKLKQLHFGTKQLNEQRIFDFLDFYKYFSFWHAYQRTVFARLKYARDAPTYLYRFDFDSPEFTICRGMFCGKDRIRGVSHGDDLFYLFYSSDSSKAPRYSIEFETIQRMVSIWTAFAKHGNPNCAVTQSHEWLPLKTENPYNALNIGYDISTMELPEKSKLEVWNTIYKEEQLC